MSSKQFGGRLTDRWKSEYERSPHWKNGKFQNLISTQSGVKFHQIPGIIYRQFKNNNISTPARNLPVSPLDADAFMKDDTEFKYVWYGHSVLLMRLAGKTILIDPMFGGDCSPIGPKRTKRFSENTLDQIDTLPEIDLVLITHDHYDHLDYDSILRLKAKVKNYYVAVGVKRHLLSWGVDEQLIVEFDWWQTRPFDNIRIDFTPTRHFSGRGLSSLAKCLWGGWVLRTGHLRVWFSGDSGYGPHFKDIGQQLGPFNVGFIECGQYCVDWPDIHMFPEDGVTAALEANVMKAMPVHWAGFNLSYQHHWFEPPETFAKIAKEKSLEVFSTRLGEIGNLHASFSPWWTEFK